MLLEASESFCWAGLNDSLLQVFLYVCVCDPLTMLLVLHNGIVSRSLAGSAVYSVFVYLFVPSKMLRFAGVASAAGVCCKRQCSDGRGTPANEQGCQGPH